MTRSWLINDEHLDHLIDRKFDGRVGEFVSVSGVDKNTARRWLKSSHATTYGSTVNQLTRTFALPAAAFAFRRSEEAAKPPKWLEAVLEFSCNQQNFITHEPVLSRCDQYPIVRSWPYTSVTQPCWGLIRIEHRAPILDLELCAMTTVKQCPLWFSLGTVKGNARSYAVETRKKQYSLRSGSRRAPYQFRLAVLYDSWASGFLARANTAFTATEVERICHTELVQLLKNDGAAIAAMSPMPAQSEADEDLPFCSHCIAKRRNDPPVSGVVRRDGSPVRRPAVSNGRR